MNDWWPRSGLALLLAASAACLLANVVLWLVLLLQTSH